MNTHLKKIVIAALLAAFTCIATMSIRIPTPGTGGYIHPGDAIVLLSGIILGPGYGFLAAGIGSALADLLGGYLVYVPATFIIKGIAAFSSGMIWQRAARTAYVADRTKWAGSLCRTEHDCEAISSSHASAHPSRGSCHIGDKVSYMTRKRRYFAIFLCGICNTAFVTLGYFLYEAPMYGTGAAASMPANVIQGLSGLILAAALYPILMAAPDIRQITALTEKP